jgi:prolyl-tRNA synthetase
MRAASGPIGGDDTHEFLVLASTGESEVFFDRAVTELKLGRREVDYDNRQQVASICQEFTRLYARTDETHDAALFEQIPEERRVVGRGIEVGQIFFFGTKYSESMNAYVTSAEGARVPVQMGSHGIGVSRSSARSSRRRTTTRHRLARGRDALPRRDRESQAGRHRRRRGLRGLYQAIKARGLDPLYDDRDARAGEKFATTDLIGLPWRITVGPRGLGRGVVRTHVAPHGRE